MASTELIITIVPQCTKANLNKQKKFEDYAIIRYIDAKSAGEPRVINQLRPNGVRQPREESSVLAKMIQKINGMSGQQI